MASITSGAYLLFAGGVFVLNLGIICISLNLKLRRRAFDLKFTFYWFEIKEL